MNCQVYLLKHKMNNMNGNCIFFVWWNQFLAKSTRVSLTGTLVYSPLLILQELFFNSLSLIISPEKDISIIISVIDILDDTCDGVVAADDAPGLEDALLGLLPQHPLIPPLLLQLHLYDGLLISSAEQRFIQWTHWSMWWWTCWSLPQWWGWVEWC